MKSALIGTVAVCPSDRNFNTSLYSNPRSLAELSWIDLKFLSKGISGQALKPSGDINKSEIMFCP